MGTIRTIFKIMTGSEYQAFNETGQFSGSPIDIEDGFIHFSTSEQAQETADKHFSQHDEIWVLEIDLKRFADNLKWEPSRGGDLFPHLYGLDLLIDDVVAATKAIYENGRFHF